MSSNGLEGKRVAIIGYGVMGKSILNGLIKSGLVPWDHLEATTIPELLSETQSSNPDLSISTDNMNAIRRADIIVFSLKPKVLLDFLQSNSDSDLFKCEGKTFISIAAGVTLDQLGKFVKAPADLIRVMPNVTASVQKSMSIICPAASCSKQSKKLAFDLFGTSGRCCELPESQFDVATALCGSGPAFYCTIIEGMAAGAIQMGLPAALAIELASQTMEGTAAMILASVDHPAVIRDRVTTPGGCTIAGLAAMEEGGIRAILSKTIVDCTCKAANMNSKK